MLQSRVCSPIPICPFGCRTEAVRRGHYFRSSDRAFVQRYQCRCCSRSFSEASLGPCYRQKKRQLNGMIIQLLCGGFSQRRSAMVLRINRKTVVRTFCLLGQLAEQSLVAFNLQRPRVEHMQFDDLETFEHSKLKPLSVTMAVEHRTRRILGFQVSEMPAKGLLTRQALKKYGKRKDGRAKARRMLFQQMKPILVENAVISSDQNPHYTQDVARYFPGCSHEVFKGRRGCVVGQGELKGGGYDPLFSLNHTYAMLRANINRLFRRTWCTTKKRERLGYHIALYSMYHNHLLI